MSDSGNSSSMMEVIGSIASDVGKATGQAIKEAAATSVGKSTQSSAPTQSSSGNKMTPQEAANYNFQKRIIQNAMDQQRMKSQQTAMQKSQQAEVQQSAKSAPVSQSGPQPTLRNDLAENMSELRAGRKGG